MHTRLRRAVWRRAMGLGGVGLLSLIAAPAHGNITLFTTTSDFTGWSSGAPSAAYDFDGSTVNGAGNNPGNSGSSINVGGSSPGGSLQLTESSSLGYSELSFSPGEAYNNAFMSAIDPGSITAYSAASGFGPGSTAAYSGTILLTYTVPTISSGTYEQIGVNLDYPAGGYYSPFFGPAVSDGTVDGLPTFTATIPYTVIAGAATLTNFQLAIQSNSDYVPTSPFYVDDIQVVTAPVPEPASVVGIIGMTACSALCRRRKRA